MTDYQVLFLLMTLMALFFMFIADHYRTKYMTLRRNLNQLVFERDSNLYQLTQYKAKRATAMAVEVIDVPAVERFYDNCAKTLQ